MEPHTLAVLGLLLNGIGAFVLIFFPPPVSAPDIMQDGRTKHVQSVVHQPPPVTKTEITTGKMKFYMRHYGYRTGLILLVAGFVLQLASECMR